MSETARDVVGKIARTVFGGGLAEGDLKFAAALARHLAGVCEHEKVVTNKQAGWSAFNSGAETCAAALRAFADELEKGK